MDDEVQWSYYQSVDELCQFLEQHCLAQCTLQKCCNYTSVKQKLELIIQICVSMCLSYFVNSLNVQTVCYRSILKIHHAWEPSALMTPTHSILGRQQSWQQALEKEQPFECWNFMESLSEALSEPLAECRSSVDGPSLAQIYLYILKQAVDRRLVI